MPKGLISLLIIMGWFARKVLVERIPNVPEAALCPETLREAIHAFSPPLKS